MPKQFLYYNSPSHPEPVTPDLEVFEDTIFDACNGCGEAIGIWDAALVYERVQARADPSTYVEVQRRTCRSCESVMARLFVGTSMRPALTDDDRAVLVGPSTGPRARLRETGTPPAVGASLWWVEEVGTPETVLHRHFLNGLPSPEAFTAAFQLAGELRNVLLHEWAVRACTGCGREFLLGGGAMPCPHCRIVNTRKRKRAQYDPLEGFIALKADADDAQLFDALKRIKLLWGGRLNAFHRNDPALNARVEAMARRMGILA